MKRRTEKIREFLGQKIGVIRTAACIPAMLIGSTQRVCAATTTTGIAQIDQAFAIIKAVLLGIVALIGVIILIKSIGDTAQAVQQQDSRGMYDGARGIAAGLIMFCAGAILGLFGIV